VATSNVGASFSLEDYQDAPDEMRAVLEKLLPDLRRMKTGMDGALGKGLSLTQNFNAAIKSIDVITAALWQTPSAFQNGWLNHIPTARYRKDAAGRVQLAGAVKSGSAMGTTAFTLPVGYRPDQPVYLACMTNGGVYGMVAIETDGSVKPTTGVTAEMFLDCDFTAADTSPVASLATAVKVATDLQGGKALGVLALEAFESGRPDLRVANPALTWANTGDGQVLLSDAQGLRPSRTYTLTLLILGG
jgi:hypothetical protein